MRFPLTLGLFVVAPAVAIALSATPQKPVATTPPVNDGHGDYVYVPAGAFKMGDRKSVV